MFVLSKDLSLDYKLNNAVETMFINIVDEHMGGLKYNYVDVTISDLERNKLSLNMKYNLNIKYKEKKLQKDITLKSENFSKLYKNTEYIDFDDYMPYYIDSIMIYNASMEPNFYWVYDDYKETKIFNATLVVNFDIDISKIPQNDEEIKKLYNIICTENTVENVLYAREWAKFLGYNVDNTTPKLKICKIIKSHFSF